MAAWSPWGRRVWGDEFTGLRTPVDLKEALTRFCRDVCGNGYCGWKKYLVTKAKTDRNPTAGDSGRFCGRDVFRVLRGDETSSLTRRVDATALGSAVFFGRENCFGFGNKLLKVLTGL